MNAPLRVGELALEFQKAQAEAPAFIGIRRVVELSGLSRNTVHRWIAAGRFPAPVIREGITVRWDLGEVLAWRAQQFEKRREREQQAEGAGA